MSGDEQLVTDFFHPRSCLWSVSDWCCQVTTFQGWGRKCFPVNPPMGSCHPPKSFGVPARPKLEGDAFPRGRGGVGISMAKKEPGVPQVVRTIGD